ncbi:exocyst complex component Sec6 [Auriscalpium vulgare]|uniref:Exocyst complex component Sec6 n=1 Tax=Auriscalpium vulgare TaxID=40419 RepID=A0ACB8RBZ0_9AGAM|nr:exocyst complex component Sec6 [Auriscalpium vulgare]
MSAPTTSAAQAVGEYLQSPDDLMKIPAFRKKLEKEKASIDARLKSGVREQLGATRDSLRKLFSTRDNVQLIRDEMVTIDRLCSDPQNTVATFDQISRVSMVHRNFEQTEEMVNNLIEMGSRLDALEDMLDADRSNIYSSAPNLLPVHYQLNQLETFRNQTMHQAKTASMQSRGALSRMFERLNKVIEAFDNYLMELASNMLPIARAGHPGAIVKLVKIAEIEGKADEKAVGIKLLKKAAKMDAASKFKSMQADARVLKYYRSKIMKTVTESIKQKFDRAWERDEKDPLAFLEGLQWLYQDIIALERDLVPCFSPDWDIYSHFVKEYHKALNATIKRMIASEPDASVLLSLHAWLKDYKANMKELEIPPELIEPPLLDGKEQTLIDDYLALIVKKLEEWTANLMKTEVDEFTTRAEPPEVDADGQYGMQGAIILFQMVNQQVDAATESGQGLILARVVGEVNRVMRGAQDQWTRLIDDEFKKHAEKPEEVPGGLVEYVIALANDQIKSADFAEVLSTRVEPLVSEKYRVTINERLNDAMDGYLDVAKKCTQTLIDIIFNDLKPATKLLFQPAWYDGIMRQIVETMRDYMTDYQTYLNSSLLELLVEDLLDAFLVKYLTALANTPKLKIPAATERIKEDVSEAFSFFSTLKPAKELESYFEVIEMILSMLEASKSLAFLSFWSFAKVHGPNIAFVESLMKARGDLDRSAVNEVMDSIKRKVKDEGLTDPEEGTIMKKIAIQGTLSRILRTGIS